ncbi:hypothetical protein LTR50_001676 [Elasticomyces elasticus]|nr:hypothetical protein LTR50_001676 [Elasticomyces elasticus]
MTLYFSNICSLFDDLHSPVLLQAERHRVYGLREARLVLVLKRSLGLGISRVNDLEGYKTAGNGDLGECVERVIASGGPPALPEVTIDEVDRALHAVAEDCRFSTPSVRTLPSPDEATASLFHLFPRLSPRSAKWLVRLVLRTAVPLDEATVLKSTHFLLPDLYRFQQDFGAAVALLRGHLSRFPPKPDALSEVLLREQASTLLRPAVGVKVGRPTFHKARSIQHCLQLTGKRRWSVERKYDGEYCEVHVDLERGLQNCIQIYSKSGKESTADRAKLHGTLRECLRIGRPECKFEKHCILLGELVVFSDLESQILEFHKIRKHVSRSGSFIGTGADSQAHLHEHLMIVLFDLLLVDDDLVLARPLEQRRARLREIYFKKRGRAVSAEWRVIDFAAGGAGKRLIDHLAASNAARCEGLVLKPCDAPYFSLSDQATKGLDGFIKVKKDYISGLGDEADFAVIGASYDARQTQKNGLQTIKWNSFHLGCLTNKAEVLRSGMRPIFRVVGTIKQDHCIPRPVLERANELCAAYGLSEHGRCSARSFDLTADSNMTMGMTLAKPFVFEVLGSSFDKPANKGFYMLRHRRVRKLHEDRSWEDCVSFDELQKQANEALSAPASSESQEVLLWIDKIEKSCKRKLDRASCQTTPQSVKTLPSPVSSRRSVHKKVSCVIVREDTAEHLEDPAKRVRLTAARRPTPGSPLADVPNRNRQSTTCLRSSIVEMDKVEVTEDRQKAIGPTDHRLISTIQACSTIDRPIASSVSHHCFLSKAVVYLRLSECSEKTKGTLRKLTAHGAQVIDDLSHWDRDSFSHPKLTDTVSESQAYGDRQKIVLCDPTESGGTLQECLDAVKGLNGGKFRERIEFYDLKIVDQLDCTTIAGEDSNRDAAQRCYLGVVSYDEDTGMMSFIDHR